MIFFIVLLKKLVQKKEIWPFKDFILSLLKHIQL